MALTNSQSKSRSKPGAAAVADLRCFNNYIYRIAYYIQYHIIYIYVSVMYAVHSKTGAVCRSGVTMSSYQYIYIHVKLNNYVCA